MFKPTVLGHSGMSCPDCARTVGGIPDSAGQSSESQGAGSLIPQGRQFLEAPRGFLEGLLHSSTLPRGPALLSNIPRAFLEPFLEPSSRLEAFLEGGGAASSRLPRGSSRPPRGFLEASSRPSIRILQCCVLVHVCLQIIEQCSVCEPTFSRSCTTSPQENVQPNLQQT